jgi:hypothetical protein
MTLWAGTKTDAPDSSRLTESEASCRMPGHGDDGTTDRTVPRLAGPPAPGQLRENFPGTLADAELTLKPTELQPRAADYTAEARP